MIPMFVGKDETSPLHMTINSFTSKDRGNISVGNTSTERTMTITMSGVNSTTHGVTFRIEILPGTS